MIYLILAIVFLLLQGFFAGMETGMVSLLKPRVEHAAKKEKSRTVQQMLFFESNPGIMISTTLVAVNLCVVGASLMSKKFLEYCGINGGFGILLATIILSILLLTIEIIPKDWFRQSPFERCSMGISVLYFVYLVLKWPIQLFAQLTEYLNNKLVPQDENSNGKVYDDFRLFLRESENGGVVDAATADILENVISIPSVKIKMLRKPQNEVLDIHQDMTVRQAFEFAKQHQQETIPVYMAEDDSSPEKTHQWYGIFNVYEVIYSLDESYWDSTCVKACISPIHTISENDNILSALKISRSQKVSLFVTTDSEYRQTGILSPDDLASFLFK